MDTVNELKPDTCLTCLGGGEVSSERGMTRCPDCDGTGAIGDAYARSENHLRQLEVRMGNLTGEAAADATWLIGELRRSRQALLKVMTAAQDGNENDELLRRIRFEANEALGIYKVSPKG